MADALNGCYLGVNDPQSGTLETLCGSQGAIAGAEVIETTDGKIALKGRIVSGLEMEIEDAIKLDGLDEKWNVDGPALLAKLHAMSPQQRETLVRGVAAVWERNDRNFERDLDALQV
ncbi:MAG: hypothetical protein KGL39_35850 [Patescibacteria group bacterium]|nr:hypothetical protein [Patescibacteria group bacterium]